MAGNRGGIKGIPTYLAYGLQVFDLCTDQICRFVETPDTDKGSYTELMLVVIILSNCFGMQLQIFLELLH